MAGEDNLTMSQKDLKRLHVIHRILDKALSQKEASEILGLCGRQVRRLVQRIHKEGDKGILHKSLGRVSHNAFNPELKQKAIGLYQKKYPDFGPVFGSEKLFENHKIKLSDETLRRWLMEYKIPYRTHKKQPHRTWRERKPCFGQMVQMDGSHHPWLEGRGPRLVLMAYIDDATGCVFARFYDYEGTFPAFESFKHYIQKYGIPQSVYLDKHTTYKSPAKPSAWQELDHKYQSQFERALEELGVSVIHANSPQAKGRVERLFRTFQNRLVKEMRLSYVRSRDQANEFLKGYLPGYNRRFCVKPLNDTNLHRPITKDLDLNSVFSIRGERALRNDSTLCYEGRLYQVQEPLNAKFLRIEERLDGKIHVFHQDSRVRFTEILSRPMKMVPPKIRVPRKTLVIKPEHPWKDSYKTIPNQIIKKRPF